MIQKIGTECRKRPNRTFPRYFSLCDAGRIARNVVEDRKETPEVVLACIAKQLGFKTISLSRERVVESSVTLSKDKVIIAINLLKTSLELLVKRFRFLGPTIAVILKSIDRIVDLVTRIIDADPTEPVEEVLQGKCNCKEKPLTLRG